ncbi:acetyl-CoA synthetase-like protein [Aspergillus sergii]|uniref:Acetyl-CoA synthetase-like protein n=1 Tax=Aspergillus sergii TaxID=1034303 RepID=A0A5N6XJW4_9EURO|nr:acetyl-CoA synthetase-like protein [Aspergillus sergii]
MSSSPVSELHGDPLLHQPSSIGEDFDRSVRNYPLNLAIISTHQPSNLYGVQSVALNDAEYHRHPYLRWTYQDLDRCITRLTLSLASRGISKGTPFFTFLPNTVEYVMATFAAYRLGCIHTPINPRNLSNPAEVEHMIRTVNDNWQSEHIVILSSGADVLQQIDQLDLHMNRIRIAVDDAADGWISFKDFMVVPGFLPQLPHPSESRESSDDASVLFTSGTTALPKACLIRGKTLLSTQHWSPNPAWVDPRDIIAVAIPNNHAFFILQAYSAWTHGATVVFPGPRFVPQVMIDTLQRERCTHTALVPTMVHALVGVKPSNGGKVGSLLGITLSAASISPTVVELCLNDLGAAGVHVHYGMTEGVNAQAPPITDVEATRHQGNLPVGRPARGAKIRICDPDGGTTPLARGTPGELHFAGPQLISGYIDLGYDKFYIGDDGNWWFPTGDQAVVDNEGRLYIVGRYKETIIRGGENIAPNAIEAVLHRYPTLQALQPQIVGAPDPIAGDVPVAIVNQEVGSDVTRQLKETVRANMGNMFVPVDVISLQTLGLDDYPKTMSGKIQKVKLAAIVREFRQTTTPAQDKSNTPALEETIKDLWAQMVGVDASLIDATSTVENWADSTTLAGARKAIWHEMGRGVSWSDWEAADTISAQVGLIQRAGPISPSSPPSSDSSSDGHSRAITPISSPEACSSGASVMASLMASIAAITGTDMSNVDGEFRLADLGVDSITGLNVLNRVKKETGLELSTSIFFDTHTLGELAESIGAPALSSLPNTSNTPEKRKLCFAKLLHGQPRPDTPSLYLFPPASGYPFSFANLSPFPDNRAVYTFGSPYLSSAAKSSWSVTDMAFAYIDKIRSLQPHGPYLLGGWSLGGIVSYEVAFHLRSQGEKIIGLIMFDSPVPKHVPNMPDPTFELFKLANILQPIVRDGKSYVETPLFRQAHIADTIRAVNRYQPRPIEASGSSEPLPIFIIWAMIGEDEKLLEKIAEAGELMEQYGPDTDRRVDDGWTFERRKVVGPGGWDQLVGVDNVDWRTVEGDHEGILWPPLADTTSQYMHEAVDRFGSS